jgi:RHS repeat-associated protein
VYEYDLKDHLGNTRVTIMPDPADATQQTAKVLQESDYYAFGYGIQSLQPTSSPKNEYLYNHKELQEETQLYDYGARFYDPVIARWTSVDPLAEKMRRFSPYNYGDDNSIRNIDPDGMETQGCCGSYFSNLSDLITGATHALLSDATTGNLSPASYNNSEVGAFGEKIGHVLAIGQGLNEIGGGTAGEAAGVVGAPETGGASLAIEAPSVALQLHGTSMVTNAVGALFKGSGVLSASSSSPNTNSNNSSNGNNNNSTPSLQKQAEDLSKNYMGIKIL